MVGARGLAFRPAKCYQTSTMSEIPLPQLDLREQIARIDRNLAETEKLFAEAGKFNLDIRIVPLTAFGAILAAVSGSPNC